jgi:hypothetical protein
MDSILAIVSSLTGGLTQVGVTVNASVLVFFLVILGLFLAATAVESLVY